MRNLNLTAQNLNDSNIYCIKLIHTAKNKASYYKHIEGQGYRIQTPEMIIPYELMEVLVKQEELEAEITYHVNYK